MLWSSNVFAALNNVQTELQLSCGVLPGRFEAALSQEYLLALQAVINGDHAFGKARSACKAVLEDGAVLERIVEDYPRCLPLPRGESPVPQRQVFEPGALLQHKGTVAHQFSLFFFG